MRRNAEARGFALAPEHERRWHEFLEFWEASELKKFHRAGKDDADYLVEFERQIEAFGKNLKFFINTVAYKMAGMPQKDILL